MIKENELKLLLNGSKHIVASGVMSNLVGMWAIIWEEDKIKHILFINGKADDKYFIVQAVSQINGDGNVCKLAKLDDMVAWSFYPTRDIIDMCLDDYYKHNRNRYQLNL